MFNNNNNSEKTTKKEKRQHNVVASGVVQSDETALKTVRPTNNKFSTVENIPFTHGLLLLLLSLFFSSCSFVRVSTKEPPAIAAFTLTPPAVEFELFISVVKRLFCFVLFFLSLLSFIHSFTID